MHDAISSASTLDCLLSLTISLRTRLLVEGNSDKFFIVSYPAGLGLTIFVDSSFSCRKIGLGLGLGRRRRRLSLDGLSLSVRGLSLDKFVGLSLRMKLSLDKLS